MQIIFMDNILWKLAGVLPNFFGLQHFPTDFDSRYFFSQLPENGFSYSSLWSSSLV